MNYITKDFFYKKEILDLLELDENQKYSLFYIYFKFKDFITNDDTKKLFKLYRNTELIKYNLLEKENKLIDYIYKNFTIKYKYCKLDTGIIIKDIII
jgi:hypothetical protein